MGQTPEERAWEAAEKLAGQGERVSTRSVMRAAGVSNALARDTAKKWNLQADKYADVPDMPEVLGVRLEKMWAEAFLLAQDQFAAEREGWHGRIDDLSVELEEMETEHAREIEQVKQQAAALTAQLSQAKDDLAGMDAVLKNERAEVQRLKMELAAMEGGYNATLKLIDELKVAVGSADKAHSATGARTKAKKA